MGDVNVYGDSNIPFVFIREPWHYYPCLLMATGVCCFRCWTANLVHASICQIADQTLVSAFLDDSSALTATLDRTSSLCACVHTNCAVRMVDTASQVPRGSFARMGSLGHRIVNVGLWVAQVGAAELCDQMIEPIVCVISFSMDHVAVHCG